MTDLLYNGGTPSLIQITQCISDNKVKTEIRDACRMHERDKIVQRFTGKSRIEETTTEIYKDGRII
jgi:hypothetical protein